MGLLKVVKTTVDLPENLLRDARQYADARGLTFNEVLIQALDLLIFKGEPQPARPGWEFLFGAFEGDEELAAVQEVIDREFSRVDIEDWK